jgi:protein required for attachment to host cells
MSAQPEKRHALRPTPAQASPASIIWVLVADGGRATVYRYHRNATAMPMYEANRQPSDEKKKHHDLTLIPGMELKAESLDDFQVGHDGRGSLIGGANSAHNTCEPHLDIRTEVKQKLVVELAVKLKQAYADKSFDHLVIAASPEILGGLRRHLDSTVLNAVIAEVNKDFTHDKKSALLAHLEKTFERAHVA